MDVYNVDRMKGASECRFVRGLKNISGTTLGDICAVRMAEEGTHTHDVITKHIGTATSLLLFSTQSLAHSFFFLYSFHPLPE